MGDRKGKGGKGKKRGKGEGMMEKGSVEDGTGIGIVPV